MPMKTFAGAPGCCCDSPSCVLFSDVFSVDPEVTYSAPDVIPSEGFWKVSEGSVTLNDTLLFASGAVITSEFFEENPEHADKRSLRFTITFETDASGEGIIIRPVSGLTITISSVYHEGAMVWRLTATGLEPRYFGSWSPGTILVVHICLTEESVLINIPLFDFFVSDPIPLPVDDPPLPITFDLQSIGTIKVWSAILEDSGDVLCRCAAHLPGLNTCFTQIGVQRLSVFVELPSFSERTDLLPEQWFYPDQSRAFDWCEKYDSKGAAPQNSLDALPCSSLKKTYRLFSSWGATTQGLPFRAACNWQIGVPSVCLRTAHEDGRRRYGVPYYPPLTGVDPPGPIFNTTYQSTLPSSFPHMTINASLRIVPDPKPLDWVKPIQYEGFADDQLGLWGMHVSVGNQQTILFRHHEDRDPEYGDQVFTPLPIDEIYDPDSQSGSYFEVAQSRYIPRHPDLVIFNLLKRVSGSWVLDGEGDVPGWHLTTNNGEYYTVVRPIPSNPLATGFLHLPAPVWEEMTSEIGLDNCVTNHIIVENQPLLGFFENCACIPDGPAKVTVVKG